VAGQGTVVSDIVSVPPMDLSKGKALAGAGCSLRAGPAAGQVTADCTGLRLAGHIETAEAAAELKISGRFLAVGSLADARLVDVSQFPGEGERGPNQEGAGLWVLEPGEVGTCGALRAPSLLAWVKSFLPVLCRAAPVPQPKADQPAKVAATAQAAAATATASGRSSGAKPDSAVPAGSASVTAAPVPPAAAKPLACVGDEACAGGASSETGASPTAHSTASKQVQAGAAPAAAAPSTILSSTGAPQATAKGSTAGVASTASGADPAPRCKAGSGRSCNCEDGWAGGSCVRVRPCVGQHDFHGV
jgi:hypothetical protein